MVKFDPRQSLAGLPVSKGVGKRQKNIRLPAEKQEKQVSGLDIKQIWFSR
jgi:hypothetical protein